MISIWLLCALTAFQNDTAKTPPETLRYVRPAGEKFVLESQIDFKKAAGGTQYVSVTHRAKVKMTLMLFLDQERDIQSAVTMLETPEGKKVAKATIDGKKVQVQQQGKDVEEILFDKEPKVVTTAPDWSDILFLMRQYDYDKKGKQEFAGLWFHPVQPARQLTFIVDRLGEDEIAIKEKKKTVGRYQVTLRSGNYLVWADDSGLVVKLMPPKRPQGAVILSGYEAATASLQ